METAKNIILKTFRFLPYLPATCVILHLSAEAGVVVTDYMDTATGVMVETENEGGRFTEVTLNLVVTVTDKSMIQKANVLLSEGKRTMFHC